MKATIISSFSPLSIPSGSVYAKSLIAPGTEQVMSSTNLTV